MGHIEEQKTLCETYLNNEFSCPYFPVFRQQRRFTDYIFVYNPLTENMDLKTPYLHTFHAVRCTMTETCLRSYQTLAMGYFMKTSDE